VDEDEPRDDGRRLRSERNRLAVIDALLGLYDQGILEPSASLIAEASGVSERSVYRYFADLEDLAASALTRQFVQVLPYFADPDPEGSLPQRAEALVDQRIRLHDRMANLARAAAFHAVRSPTLARAVADRRRMLRDQVARQFATEFEGLPSRRVRILLAGLDQVTSLEALDYLRSDSGGSLSRRDLKVALLDQIAALLAGAHLHEETT
jgi:AcrR family transcriptional regulator